MKAAISVDLSKNPKLAAILAAPREEKPEGVCGKCGDPVYHNDGFVWRTENYGGEEYPVCRACQPDKYW